MTGHSVLPSGGSLVDVRGLVVRYGGIAAVQGIDLSIDAGKAVAIVGPNGAGKTSLLSAIAGIVRPSAGAIQIAGRPLAGLAVEDERSA